MDDAFVTFRFAENFVRTGQFVWNIGEAPLEGVSTFLFTLILVPLVWVGADLVLAAKAIGILASHATLFVLCRMTAREHSEDVAFIPALLLASIPASGIHSVSGMETTLYLMFIALLMWR
ncbi:MAG: hypothetical protein QXS20_08865 [Candidatus Thorarchaeota archaeon]